jgi:putative ABC transport system ATP-binding protein
LDRLCVVSDVAPPASVAGVDCLDELPSGQALTRNAISATSSGISMLEARDLTKEYISGSQKLRVLRGVSFSVEQGDFVSIVGPSGSGKTTLLGLLAGLDTPTMGNAILDGVDLGTLSEDDRARVRGEKVGFIFQTFQLIPSLNALENIQVPLELRGDARARERARELLQRVGLAERAHHFPVQLSGGEQQRVAIARACVNRPRVLFADEPTGNLDAASAGNILELIDELNSETRATVLLVTHDREVAARARRRIGLRDGAIVEDSRSAA